ncbi:MAG: ArsR/SmtB family transcription factor [Solirubrobacterales bacterium]
MSSLEQGKRRDRRLEQPDFVTAINHPLRVHLLATLRDREASPSELAKELGEDLGVVNYHARKLERLGMVEIVRERPVRGSTEHFYKATTRPWWTTEQWAEVDSQTKSVATAWGIDRIFKDAGAAVTAGTFDSRDERHLSRTPVLLDEEGWSAIAALLDETLDGILEEQAKAAQRLSQSGEEAIPALVVMLSFETPANEPQPTPEA